ncbi:DUF1398 domain-containing protein [Asticcacaulis sp. YBE204]|uniref:DUF1398 domain-containing protein n=1 Tax=Asticcacaulis sp. YBE204 TaxID=1282363 RepID=UPI0003C3DECF|nr:DUF1398 family protein [Asticcacaulis sp. YBE204]ESQ79669.1 hypothetical protein AEYBE204_07450 [Asticcacaulis sp. YBE204]
MDAQSIAVAEACLYGAETGALSFPEIVGKLIEAGFEGYHIDYRRGTATYVGPDGDSVELKGITLPVAASFEAAGVAAAVREAQTNAPGYTYRGFSEKVTAAGCAGYIVSFPGRRVLYYGRTAETHVEHFPDR